METGYHIPRFRGEGAFYAGSALQNPEAFCDIGSLDNLHSPAPDALEGIIMFP